MIIKESSLDEALIKLATQKAKEFSLDEFNHWWVENFILKTGNSEGNKIITSKLNIKDNSNIDVIYNQLLKFP